MAEEGLPQGASDSDLVQRAVETFIDRRRKDPDLEPSAFAREFPELLRKKISARCRHFLQFDDFVGSIQKDDGRDAEPEGRRFGEYVIEGELGRGGMGVVYLAQQPSLRRRVALKVLASGLALSPRHVERFRREAAAAASVEHPALVPVHGFCEVDGTYAFAMEFVAGRNLGVVLDELRLQSSENAPLADGTLGLVRRQGEGYVAECARLCADLASALAAAHGKGIAHRDLKPRNVMIDDRRRVRLLDFGLAKQLDQESLTASFDITGTVHYMSPEQTLQKKVVQDHRTDVFSLGVILYELLTLARPFDGKNLQAIVYEICFRDPKPIVQRNPRVPRDLVAICEKALEKDPQNRYQTAADFERDLRAFLAYEPVQAKPATWLVRAQKWTRRHRAASISIGAATLALTTLVAVGAWRSHAREQQVHDLLQQAAVAATQGDHARAVELATDALRTSPDDAEVMARLDLARKDGELAATEAARRRAEATALLLQSKQKSARDRDAALDLALRANELDRTPRTRGALLEALAAGYRTLAFDPTRAAARAVASPDGNLVATICLAGEARLFDARTGTLRRALLGRGAALDARFSPDGRFLATGDERGATLWRTDDGTEVRHFDRPGAVYAVDFDDRGERLLATDNLRPANADPVAPPQVTVFEVASGRVLAAVPGAKWSQAVDLAGDGGLVASAGTENAVQVWNVADGTESLRLPVDGHVLSLQFHPARGTPTQLCLSTDAGLVRVHALPSGDVLGEARQGRSVNRAAFAPDGRRVATAGSDGTARVYELPSAAAFVEASSSPSESPVRRVPQLAERVLLPGHGAEVFAIAFDDAGRRLATGCADALVRVFDADSGAERLRHEASGPVHDVRFAGETRLLFEASGRRTFALDFDAPTGVLPLPHGEWALCARFHPEDGTVFTAAGELAPVVAVWDARSGTLLRRFDGLPSGGGVQAMDVDARGERVLVGTFSGRAAVFDPRNGTVLWSVQDVDDRQLETAAFARDGRTCVLASLRSGRVRVRDAATGEIRFERVLATGARSAALSADGNVIATVARDATVVELTGVPDGSVRGALRGHTGPVRSVRALADGMHWLTAAEDGTARLFAADGTLVRTMQAGEPLAFAEASADGSRVLCATIGSRDAAVHVFDLATGAALLHSALHDSRLRAGALSSDGRLAITCGSDLFPKLWPTDPEAAAEALRAATPTSPR